MHSFIHKLYNGLDRVIQQYWPGGRRAAARKSPAHQRVQKARNYGCGKITKREFSELLRYLIANGRLEQLDLKYSSAVRLTPFERMCSRENIPLASIHQRALFPGDEFCRVLYLRDEGKEAAKKWLQRNAGSNLFWRSV